MPFSSLTLSPQLVDIRINFTRNAQQLAEDRTFFSERVINAWNSLPTELDFASLKRFRRAIENVDFSAFTKRF